MKYKLIDIINIWEEQYTPSDLQKEIINHRATVCEECPQLKFNESNQFFFCGGCGCSLGNKLFNPQKAGLCPLNNWEK
jgi:hypothetical protein